MGQFLSTIFHWWLDKVDDKKKLTTGKQPLTSPITNSPPSLTSCSNFNSDDEAKLKIQVVGNENQVSVRPQRYNNRVEEIEQRLDPSSNLFIPTKLKIEVVGSEKHVFARPLQLYSRVEETGERTSCRVVGRNWRDYRSSKEEEKEDLQEDGKGQGQGKGKEKTSSIGVRRIKHYRSDYKILLVGEGDFSFSVSLALAFASATNITATSIDSIASGQLSLLQFSEFLSRNYSRALSNINRLQNLGALVIHDVDATKMANVFPFKHMLLDRVIYNFPLAGFFTNEEREDQIRRNQKLIQLFLQNAKKMIQKDGEIHVTHKTNGFFKEWNLEFLASIVGLRLIEEVPFNLRDYPGYCTKYGFGGDNNFDCVPSRTYKFGLRKPTKKASYRLKN